MEGYSPAPAVPPRVGAKKTIDHNREFTYRADAVFARNSSLTDFADTVDARAEGANKSARSRRFPPGQVRCLQW